MIEVGLAALLNTTPAIQAICGARIYPVALLPNASYPALTFQLISATPDPTFDTSGFQRWRIQFDCFGEAYADASGLRKALIKTLNGYQGLLSDGTNLQNAEFLQLIDFFNDNARIFRCMVEFYLYFTFSS